MKKIITAALVGLLALPASGAGDLSFVRDVQAYSVRMVLSEMSRNPSVTSLGQAQGSTDCAVRAELRAFGNVARRYGMAYPVNYAQERLGDSGSGSGDAAEGEQDGVKYWSDIELGLHRHQQGSDDAAYAAALLEVICRMPANHYRRGQMISQLEALLTSCREAADPQTGMWRREPLSAQADGREPDATSSAMLVWTALKAVNRRLLSSDWADYASEAYRKFIRAFVSEDSDGVISISSCSPLAFCLWGHDHSGSAAGTGASDNGCEAVAAFIMASMEYEAAGNVVYVFDGKFVQNGKVATEKTGSDLAFSGADGGGKYSRGGKGGQVYKVTTLEDTGEPGSLRYAVQAEGPRIVEFAVGGEICLKEVLRIENPFITISGQTAPSPGVTIRDNGLYIETNDVIIRYVRFRMGAGAGGSGSAVECVRSDNVIIDHCSIGWGVNANLSLFATTNATVSRCIIAEALSGQGGECGYGAVIGGRNVSVHHNLFVSNNSGSPRFDHPALYSGDDILYRRGTVEFINNVVYNWGERAAWGGEEGWFNVIGNIYIPGSGTKSPDSRYIDMTTSAETSLTKGQFFIFGNLYEISAVYENGNYLGIRPDIKRLTVVDELNRRLSVPAPFRSPNPSTVQDSEKLFKTLLKDVGASKSQDGVDKRLVKEVQKGTTTFSGSVSGIPGLIDSENDVLQ